MEQNFKIDEYKNYEYVHISLYNNTAKYQPCQFSTNLDQPLAPNKNSKYKIAVDTMSLDSQVIPIAFFPNDGVNQKNNYSVTLSYNGANYKSVVEYVDTYGTTFETVPRFGIYSYQLFIDWVNKAFEDATTALLTANNSLVASAPYITYSAINRLLTFNYETRYLSNNAQPIDIYLSSDLFLFIGDNMMYEFFGLNTTDSKDYKLIVENTANNYNATLTPRATFSATGVKTFLTGPPSPAIPGFIMNCETANLYIWEDLVNFTIQSTMPLKKEVTPTTTTFGDNTALNNQFSNILADFEIIHTNDTARVVQQYQPSRIKYIDIMDRSQIDKIQFAVFWFTKEGIKKLLYIKPGGYMSIKFVIERKKRYIL